MEGGGVMSLWKRRGYGRVYGTRRRRMNKAKLGQGGGGGGRKKRSWGIKIARKLRLILSPKKLLTRLRDGYVNLMLRLDDSNFMMMSSTMYGGAGAGGGFGNGGPLIREYDEKRIVEMYKSLVIAQGLNLVPFDPAATAIVTAK